MYCRSPLRKEFYAEPDFVFFMADVERNEFIEVVHQNNACTDLSIKRSVND